MVEEVLQLGGVLLSESLQVQKKKRVVGQRVMMLVTYNCAGLGRCAGLGGRLSCSISVHIQQAHLGCKRLPPETGT
jgi:hypothetical protein